MVSAMGARANTKDVSVVPVNPDPALYIDDVGM